MTGEEKTQEFHFCEQCEECFPVSELQADEVYGPYLCPRCREDVEADREHYKQTNIWLEKNR